MACMAVATEVERARPPCRVQQLEQRCPAGGCSLELQTGNTARPAAELLLCMSAVQHTSHVSCTPLPPHLLGEVMVRLIPRGHARHLQACNAAEGNRESEAGCVMCLAVSQGQVVQGRAVHLQAESGTR